MPYKNTILYNSSTFLIYSVFILENTKKIENDKKLYRNI